MPDMLVKLYDLPDAAPSVRALFDKGIVIRRAIPSDRAVIEPWLVERFESWLPEVSAALSAVPATCFVAVEGNTLLGFACYDVAARNFFGPTGVDEAVRGRGVGRALLLTTLEAQRDLGYGYAIIGGVGPADFYEKAVGAVLIPGSNPGVYVR